MTDDSVKAGEHPLDTQLESSGRLLPLGNQAHFKLSERKGLYRLLPSAVELLLLQRLEPSAEKSERSIRLAGQIQGPGVICDIFAVIAQLGWRGELIVTESESQRSLYFEEGHVCGGGTSVDDERLGAVMYRYGVVTEADRATIATACAIGGRFGQLAVELGIVGQQDVYRCLRHQIEDITYAVFGLSRGTFCFLDGFDESRLVSHQRVPAQGLLMDGVTRMDEIQFFRQKVPSDEYVPARTSRATEPAPEYRNTYNSIDGRLSVGALGRVTGRGEFGATKDIYSLERSGHVTIGVPHLRYSVVDYVEAANCVLRSAFGALGQQDTTTLRDSLGSFAEGAELYETIFRGAGPAEDGTFNAPSMNSNIQRLRLEQPVPILQKLLYEYVSFAIFCVGAAVGWQREATLSEAVGDSLQLLKS